MDLAVREALYTANRIVICNDIVGPGDLAKTTGPADIAA